MALQNNVQTRGVDFKLKSMSDRKRSDVLVGSKAAFKDQACFSLNSVKAGYIGDDLGEYYRGYSGGC